MTRSRRIAFNVLYVVLDNVYLFAAVMFLARAIYDWSKPVDPVMTSGLFYTTLASVWFATWWIGRMERRHQAEVKQLTAQRDHAELMFAALYDRTKGIQ